MQLLSIFHYVLGALAVLAGCFPLLYVGLGIAMLTGGFDANQPNPPPPELGWIFLGIGSALILLCWGVAIAILVAGRKLSTRRNYTFCLVVAGVECLMVPIGTILGIFTIVVLMRPSVKQLFEAAADGV